ncbi:MAG: pyrimidine 5'-nucleotidase [Proteobacteria bacterium]|nr:pyrimidine 5'-nucleotidase [Pseudomonadota bacterium]
MTGPDKDLPGRIEAWIFDLDDTLYPASSNLFAQVAERMTDYVCGFLGLDRANAEDLRRRYFREFGTTLKGLMTRHRIDPLAFLDYVHDIDLGVIEPSPRLAAALAGLAGRKIVFTNGSIRHAERVLARLGVSGQFDAIFDIVAAGFAPKPEPAAYRVLIDRHRIEPGAAVMIEDRAVNLGPAAALGMTTVWLRTGRNLGDPGTAPENIHFTTDDLLGWLEAAGRRPGGG